MNIFKVHLKNSFISVKTLHLKVQSMSTIEDLKVLYLSDHFIAVNKGWDIPINTETPEIHRVTVADQLNYSFPHLADPSVKFGFRFCHRLDFSTSGVLVVALNKLAAKQSYVAFNSKKTDKYYLALVHGHVKDEMKIINKHIGIDSRAGYTHRMCTSDKEYCIDSKWAISKLCILQRGYFNNKPATKILLKLLTGRRHQLRVHCHEIGHTVVGDYTYSDRKDADTYRMFLHAFRLVLPCNIEPLDILSEDPFSEENKRNDWSPTEIVNDVNDITFLKLKHS